MSDREYVDVRDLHPDYQRAPCRIDGCPKSKLVPKSALVNREFTLCEEHAPDFEGALGPRVVVRI